MKTTMLRTSAIALIAAIGFVPAAAWAGKGGVPAEQAQANGQAAAHAHPNKADPNADRGNDSRRAVADPDDETSDYQQYQDATVEEEGEFDEEEGEA